MTTGFLTQSFEHDHVTQRFAVYVPNSWDGISLLPTVLYFHGRGESGACGVRQLLVGLPNAIMDHPDRWNCLVVAPQKLDPNALWPLQREWVNAMLNIVQTAYPVDMDRCAVTGYSQGGNAVFQLAGSLSWRFRSALALCGFPGENFDAHRLKDVPLWAIHGDEDGAISVAGSIAAVDSIRAVGGKARLDIMPGMPHDVWTPAYRSKEVARFLTQTYEFPART